MFAAVRPDSVNALKRELVEIGARVENDGAPFSQSSSIHFARFVLVPDDVDQALGRVGPASMYLLISTARVIADIARSRPPSRA